MKMKTDENGKMKSLPIDLIEHSDVAHSLTHSMAKETDTHTHTHRHGVRGQCCQSGDRTRAGQIHLKI